jgi:COMPASS component SWD2
MKNIPIEASYSPDSQFVLSGSSDGRIHIWNAEKGNKVAVLNSEHSDTVQCIQFNPKFMMFASSCQQMVFKYNFRFLSSNSKLIISNVDFLAPTY